MSNRLKDGFFDPSSSTIHWVHKGAEIVEAIEATMVIISTTKIGGASITVAKWLHRLESIGPASGALQGVIFPVTMGVVAVVAEFVVLGMGYADAAEKIAEEASTRGYCLGVVMGAMRERASMVENFVVKKPPVNLVFPAAGRVEQEHFNAGLVRGYAEGRELTSDQTKVLWGELLKAGGTINTPDGVATRDFYYTAAGRFRRLHIK
jgi:hypothetical protein